MLCHLLPPTKQAIQNALEILLDSAKGERGPLYRVSYLLEIILVLQ